MFTPIARSWREKQYRPKPLKIVEWPKANGGTRTIAVPTVVDRVVGAVILEVLEPLIDPHLSHYQHGYRSSRVAGRLVEAPGFKTIPRGSTEIVARRVLRAARGGRHHLVEMDIQDAFPSVSRKVLLRQVVEDGCPRWFVEIVLASLGDTAVRNGHEETVDGIPLGHPIGPLLFNWYVRRIHQEVTPGVMVCSYADNIFVAAPTNETSRLEVSRIHHLLTSIELTAKVEQETQLDPDNRFVVLKEWHVSMDANTNRVTISPTLGTADRSAPTARPRRRGQDGENPNGNADRNAPTARSGRRRRTLGTGSSSNLGEESRCAQRLQHGGSEERYHDGAGASVKGSRHKSQGGPCVPQDEKNGHAAYLSKDSCRHYERSDYCHCHKCSSEYGHDVVSASRILDGTDQGICLRGLNKIDSTSTNLWTGSPNGDDVHLDITSTATSDAETDSVRGGPHAEIHFQSRWVGGMEDEVKAILAGRNVERVFLSVPDWKTYRGSQTHRQARRNAVVTWQMMSAYITRNGVRVVAIRVPLESIWMSTPGLFGAPQECGDEGDDHWRIVESPFPEDGCLVMTLGRRSKIRTQKGGSQNTESHLVTLTKTAPRNTFTCTVLGLSSGTPEGALKAHTGPRRPNHTTATLDALADVVEALKGRGGDIIAWTHQSQIHERLNGLWRYNNPDMERAAQRLIRAIEIIDGEVRIQRAKHGGSRMQEVAIKWATRRVVELESRRVREELGL